jgi:LmbE family N-acetylglucosaminyl deacetylase
MSVLVIAPHMDDEVLGCGGVIQKFSRPVKVVFCTTLDTDERLGADGERHPYDGALRQKEMESVAEVLGFKFDLLPFDTHRLDRVSRATLLKHLEAHVKGVELLFVPAVNHDQDHEAVRKAVDSLMRPHCYAGSVLEYDTLGVDGDVVIPLTDSMLHRKMAAMGRYETQIDPGGQFYSYSTHALESRATTAGLKLGVKAAELFHAVRLVPNDTTKELFS